MISSFFHPIPERGSIFVNSRMDSVALDLPDTSNPICECPSYQILKTDDYNCLIICLFFFQKYSQGKNKDIHKDYNNKEKCLYRLLYQEESLICEISLNVENCWFTATNLHSFFSYYENSWYILVGKFKNQLCRAVVFKMWPPHQQPQHHLVTHYRWNSQASDAQQSVFE